MLLKTIFLIEDNENLDRKEEMLIKEILNLLHKFQEHPNKETFNELNNMTKKLTSL